MGLLEKFGGEQGDRHPGPLTWPGSDLGFPVIGRASPNLRQAEFEDIDHKLVYRAQEFRTWVEAEMADYCAIQERASNGWFRIRHCDRRQDPQARGLIIWLEWEQVYGILPPELAAADDAVTTYIRRSLLRDVAAGGGAVEVNPGPDAWKLADALIDSGRAAATPAGLRPYFDPFAPRNGHG
jgi:hypothetical protein